MAHADTRTEILKTFGATAATAAEILACEVNGYERVPLPPDLRFPLEDEPFVPVWRSYSVDAAAHGFMTLADRLVQLHFPIRSGISLTEEYRAATRRGLAPRGMPLATGLVLERPDEIRLVVHPTWAGAIPIVTVGWRPDFVTLVRAFSARNEPVPVPDSMGACVVTGYNNWDRVARVQQRWPLEHPDTPFSLDQLSQLKQLYQDRFIILSDGWYSSIPPEAVGMSADEWRTLSFVIRREHECAHYWTQRVLSSMQTRVLDEVLADYCGIAAACGTFRAGWFLTFFGLERFPDYRPGGRLENYRGPLSEAAFTVVMRMVHAAAEHLELFSRQHVAELRDERGLLLALLTLSRFTLEELASPAAPRMLAECLTESRAQLCTSDLLLASHHQV
jgi:hypothetical protein